MRVFLYEQKKKKKKGMRGGHAMLLLQMF